MIGEPDLLTAARRELAWRIARHAPADGAHSCAYPGLSFVRFSGPSESNCGVYRPSLTIAAQGAKRVELGEEVYEYNERHFLLSSYDLPVQARITCASPTEPYLCVALDLDPQRLGELMGDHDLPPAPEPPSMRGLAVGTTTIDLIEPMLRLVRLLDTPEHLPVLGPMAEREILYRVLTGELGRRLRQTVLPAGAASQVAQAIAWIKENYAVPLRIEELAAAVNMSASSLHHHFKAVTAMSPLQYQKHLRLREARMLMLSEWLDAGTAARRVGYESASQFSREYSRLYGSPPLRDVARLRNGEPAESQG
ncbi:MAG: AraC family transcriptional regulator [Pigmentiphaga sp.]|uniref:AraC family transcriptional regulator n=1 Tax=Pigmentiphaga sp. TaxID=1977564 RepID=UPI0029B71B8E|nr:AraC family transcriptional regulator [Pigmentiphaga sp.]MDX3907188.1 AraC family transcriptional regulator [Pigmentiphaga sp.]